MLRNLDIGVLRSFLLIADGSSFAEAADRVGRSPSAVSLQIQRLEDELGAQVFRRNNRGVALTLAGERLLVFARRIVGLNDETIQAFRSGGEVRPLRVGLTQDFAESALPDVLRRFSLEHPTAELSLRIDRSAHLLASLHAGEIDLAVAVRRDDPLARDVLVETRMAWIGREGETPDVELPVPLALFEAPCTFRSVAIDALAAAGRDYRIGFTSPSLAGLRSAVLAGLGITVRTRLLLAPGLAAIADGLPRLPDIAFSLYARSDVGSWPARDDFVELCRRAFRG
ncbi:MAG TPA: LysR substrate-binding domain-containing protein [Mesorhizobium sp.]|jgi:DNA-binding transcriptional LysR family regulator|nr:LysR substrate-binding domain-containing protein [Mesorhizobium sp.]